MAGKKSDFLSGALHGLTHELFENDDSPKAGAKTEPTAPPPSPNAPSLLNPTPMPITAPSPGVTPYTFNTTPAAPDADALKAVNDGVFGDTDTHYTHFMAMYETLGRPADPTVVLHAMQAMDKTITPALILSDISGYLSKLDAVAAKATSDFEAVASQRLGGADAQLQQLQQANENANAEIARHQKESGERITQISQITQQRAADEAAIAQAKAKTEAAEASVKQQLTSMQSLFAAQ